MKRFLRRVLPVLVVLTLVLMVTPRPARADSVVTDCGSDTQLSQLLPAGGNIHFQCGCNPTTPIVLTSTKVINTDTALDGGCSGFALSGNNVRRLFYVNPGKKTLFD